MVEKQKSKYGIGKVATQTEDMPVDNETNEAVTQLELLIRIANDLDEIKKNIVSPK